MHLVEVNDIFIYYSQKARPRRVNLFILKLPLFTHYAIILGGDDWYLPNACSFKIKWHLQFFRTEALGTWDSISTLTVDVSMMMTDVESERTIDCTIAFSLQFLRPGATDFSSKATTTTTLNTTADHRTSVCKTLIGNFSRRCPFHDADERPRCNNLKCCTILDSLAMSTMWEKSDKNSIYRVFKTPTSRLTYHRVQE